ncbi:hypothetical protein [Gordonibacter sp.]
MRYPESRRKRLKTSAILEHTFYVCRTLRNTKTRRQRS